MLWPCCSGKLATQSLNSIMARLQIRGIYQYLNLKTELLTLGDPQYRFDSIMVAAVQKHKTGVKG